MEESSATSRSYNRSSSQMRPVTLTRNVMKHAQGSCLVEFGDTRVLCAATIQEGVPRWRRGQSAGWVTAEYAMLPAATGKRTSREYKGRKGRSMEIERLIGRSLRTAVDMKKMGEYTLTVDCDVLQADGGTRTASITGAWVAMHDAFMWAVDQGYMPRLPIIHQVAAISVGRVADEYLCDLDYKEDSHAQVDMNVVGTEEGKMIEIQGTGEQLAFDRDELNALLDMAQASIEELICLQDKVTGFSE